jgi:nitrile hydratase accessory protein
MNSDIALLDVPLALGGHDSIRFSAPWEAKAFAIIVNLADSGVFTWGEWVACFSKEVAAASQLQARGEQAPSYYEQWLEAAEKLMVIKGLVSVDQLAARRFAIGASGTAHLLR